MAWPAMAVGPPVPAMSEAGPSPHLFRRHRRIFCFSMGLSEVECQPNEGGTAGENLPSRDCSGMGGFWFRGR